MLTSTVSPIIRNETFMHLHIIMILYVRSWIYNKIPIDLTSDAATWRFLLASNKYWDQKFSNNIIDCSPINSDNAQIWQPRWYYQSWQSTVFWDWWARKNAVWHHWQGDWRWKILWWIRGWNAIAWLQCKPVNWGNAGIRFDWSQCWQLVKVCQRTGSHLSLHSFFKPNEPKIGADHRKIINISREWCQYFYKPKYAKGKYLGHVTPGGTTAVPAVSTVKENVEIGSFIAMVTMQMR